MAEEQRRKKKPLRVFYRGPRAQYDYILLFATLCLMLFGLIMLYSVTNYEDLVVRGNSFYSMKKQAYFMIGGVVVMFAASKFDYHFFLRIALIIFAFAVLLCVLTMIIGIEENGQKRWLGYGSVRIQPSEIIKPALILASARMLTAKYKPKKRGQSDFNIPAFIWGAGLTAAGFLVIFKTNLSTSIIVFLIGFLMVYTASRARWVYPAIMFAGLVLLIILWQSGAIEKVLNGNRLLRIYAWLDPKQYPKTGYQILQSLYAISSGGLFGKGLGTSIQKLGFLPEAQNDMIFAIVCEELGWLGAIFVMLLFGMVIFRIHRVAQRAKDMSGFLIVSGVMFHMIIQVIFNLCVAANLMPNTGVTLPFFSSGGTAILCTLAEFGLVLAVDIQSPTESDETEAEERARMLAERRRAREVAKTDRERE